MCTESVTQILLVGPRRMRGDTMLPILAVSGLYAKCAYKGFASDKLTAEKNRARCLCPRQGYGHPQIARLTGWIGLFDLLFLLCMVFWCNTSYLGRTRLYKVSPPPTPCGFAKLFLALMYYFMIPCRRPLPWHEVRVPWHELD